jgi:hypothetical protein
MPVNTDKIWLYRIVHIDNLDFILRNGMYTRHHPNADPNYKNIGDTILISQRSDYPIKLDGYGNLGDFIPFYFGLLSPMLYNIKTGHRGIKKLPQSEIVYICCRLTATVANCPIWCFTDGHAKSHLTDFFDNLDYLDKVDWTMVNERMWNNNEEDYDRMRRKQSEFLVKDYVAVKCIGCIVVFNEEKLLIVQKKVESYQLNIPVKVNPNNKFYY